MGTVLDSHFLALTAIVTVIPLPCWISVLFIHIRLGVLLWFLYIYPWCAGGLPVHILRNHSSFQDRSSHWLCRYNLHSHTALSASVHYLILYREASSDIFVTWVSRFSFFISNSICFQVAQTSLYLLYSLSFLTPRGIFARWVSLISSPVIPHHTYSCLFFLHVLFWLFVSSQVVLTLLVVVWGLRLGTFLLMRFSTKTTLYTVSLLL